MSCGNGSVASLAGSSPSPPRRCARTATATPCCTPPSWRCAPSVAVCSTSTPTAPASTASSPSSSKRPPRACSTCHGVGVHTAALLLVAAGDNAERITSEAAFAHLCGVAPIHASSGKMTRHRLNRGGNRQANHALWRIVFTRMSSDPRTRAYVERRLAEGRSKPEIMRVLKRYVAREVYRHLPALAPRSERRVWPRNARTPPGCPANDLPARRSTHLRRHRLA